MTIKQRSANASQTAAQKWRQGTEHFLELAKPVLDEIHEKAKSTPHGSLDEDEAIVEMSIERLKSFSQEYHEVE